MRKSCGRDDRSHISPTSVRHRTRVRSAVRSTGRRAIDRWYHDQRQHGQRGARTDRASRPRFSCRCAACSSSSARASSTITARSTPRAAIPRSHFKSDRRKRRSTEQTQTIDVAPFIVGREHVRAAAFHLASARRDRFLRRHEPHRRDRDRRPVAAIRAEQPQQGPPSFEEAGYDVNQPRRRFRSTINRPYPNRTTSGSLAAGLGRRRAIIGCPAPGCRRRSPISCGRPAIGASTSVASDGIRDTGLRKSASTAASITAAATTATATRAAAGPTGPSATIAPRRT